MIRVNLAEQSVSTAYSRAARGQAYHPPARSPAVPTWLTEADLDYHTEQFQRGGFCGPLNRYRTSDVDFAQQDEIKDKKIELPTAFIAWSRCASRCPTLGSSN